MDGDKTCITLSANQTVEKSEKPMAISCRTFFPEDNRLFHQVIQSPIITINQQKIS